VGHFLKSGPLKLFLHIQKDIEIIIVIEVIIVICRNLTLSDPFYFQPHLHQLRINLQEKKERERELVGKCIGTSGRDLEACKENTIIIWL